MKKKATAIGHLKNAMEQVKSLTAQVAQAAAQDIAALETAKADKLSGVPVVIPADGWGSDSAGIYPSYYDITVPGVTAQDRATIALAPAALPAAEACCLCPACETLAGKIRLRAVSVPTAAMAANYWIEKGV